MKRALLALLLTLAACGDIDEDDPSPRDQVKECIAQGGIPSFTQSRGGYEIIEYLGCTPV